MSGVICLDCFQVNFDIIAIYVTRVIVNFTTRVMVQVLLQLELA